jgi:hypothetical protein
VEIIHKSQIARLKMRRRYSTGLLPLRFRGISTPTVTARSSSIGDCLLERDSKRIVRE